jgi:hypothetical protein
MTAKFVERFEFSFDIADHLYGHVEDVEDSTWTVEQLVGAVATRIADSVANELVRSAMQVYGNHKHNVTRVRATVGDGGYYDDSNTTICLSFQGLETEQERLKREDKERLAAEKAKAAKAKQREKDLADAEKLAKKYGLKLINAKEANDK